MTPSKSIFECTVTCGGISRYYHHSKLHVGCHHLCSFIVGIAVLERQAGKGKEETRTFGAPVVHGSRLMVLEGGLGGVFVSVLSAVGLCTCDTKSMMLHLCLSVLNPLIPWALFPSTWTFEGRVKHQTEIHVAFTVESVLFSVQVQNHLL